MRADFPVFPAGLGFGAGADGASSTWSETGSRVGSRAGSSAGFGWLFTSGRDTIGLSSNAFLLGAVLRHFFGLYASVNSFTQLELVSARRRQEVWKRWPPLAGNRELL